MKPKRRRKSKAWSWFKLKSLGKRRHPNPEYMREWEREVVLRDIRALRLEVFSARNLFIARPGAYHSPKRVSEVLESLCMTGHLARTGTAPARRVWGRMFRAERAYRVIAIPEELAA